MPNTSATGGYLTPDSSPAPLQGNPLLDFIHNWLQGLSALPGDLIRPRWQPESINIPDASVTWLAFGIIKKVADTFASEVHYPTNEGYNEIRRHEVVSFLVSVYGPNSDEIASLIRDNMQVSQNREVLQLNSMGLIASSDLTTAPELIKEKWLQRVDFSFEIRRQIKREYSVLNILSLDGTLDNERYLTQIDVE